MAGRTPVSEQKTAFHRRPGARPLPPPDIYVPVGTAPSAPAATRRPTIWLLLPLALFIMLLSAALVAAALIYRNNQILPGVHTIGVRLGGQRVAEATVELEQAWESREIILENESDLPLSLRPASLGIILDAEATALAAYRQGRNIPDIEGALRNAFSDTGFEPTWYFAPDVAEGKLREVAEQLYVAPRNAGVNFVEGEPGEPWRVEATPPVPGRELDVDATLNWLQANAGRVVLEERLPLQMGPVQPEITDVNAVIAEANQLLATPIEIDAYDPVRNERQQGNVPPAVWTQWLSLTVDETDPASLTWQVDKEAVESYLVSQADAFGSDRYLATEEAVPALSQAAQSQDHQVALRVYHHPRQHVVQSGETLSSIAYDYGIPYPWIQQSNPGLGDSLRAGQTIIIPSPDDLLPLPVVQNKRIVISLQQQRMWAYENGNLLWEWPVSTGIDSSPTAPGVFQVQSHEPNAYASNWDLWMPNFMGIYRPVPNSDFMNGFHGFPTRNGSNLLWTNSLGRPVTYGCILLSNENVQLLYSWAEEGVVVEVKP